MSSKRHSPPIRQPLQTIVLLVILICVSQSGPVQHFYARHGPAWGPRTTIQPKSDTAALIIAGARAQIGTKYDASYIEIPFPDGDVPPDRGACSDVVVRALRRAGPDLQRLIHEDILRNNDAYPDIDAVSKPNANIDHRRCLNQIHFFYRYGMTLPTEVSSRTLDQWQPGDFVYWRTPGNRQHVGVLSNRLSPKLVPLVIHNGSVCKEEDCLTDWEIIGHYRYPKADAPAPR